MINAVKQRLLWDTVLFVTLWAAILRSSSLFELSPGIQSAATALYLFGLTCLAAASFIQAKRHRSTLGKSPISWFWLLVAYAVLIGLMTDPANELPRQALMVLIGLMATAAYIGRWGETQLLRRDASTLYLALSSSVVLSLFLGLSGMPIAFGLHAGLRGVYGNQNYLGLACALVGTFALGQLLAKGVGNARGHLAVLMVAGIVVLWSGSRGSMGALAVGILLAVILSSGLEARRTRTLLWILLLDGVLVLLIPFVPRLLSRAERGTDVLTGRGEIWANLLDRVTWFGQGLFSIQQAQGTTPTGSGPQVEPFAAHNIYLQFLVGLGVVGLTIWLVFLVSVFRGSRTSELFILLGPVSVALLAYELTESSLAAGGGPLTAGCWLLLFATAAAARHQVLNLTDVALRDDAGSVVSPRPWRSFQSA